MQESSFWYHGGALTLFVEPVAATPSASETARFAIASERQTGPAQGRTPTNGREPLRKLSAVRACMLPGIPMQMSYCIEIAVGCGLCQEDRPRSKQVLARLPPGAAFLGCAKSSCHSFGLRRVFMPLLWAAQSLHALLLACLSVFMPLI